MPLQIRRTFHCSIYDITWYQNELRISRRTMFWFLCIINELLGNVTTFFFSKPHSTWLYFGPPSFKIWRVPKLLRCSQMSTMVRKRSFFIRGFKTLNRDATMLLTMSHMAQRCDLCSYELRRWVRRYNVGNDVKYSASIRSMRDITAEYMCDHDVTISTTI